MAVTIHVNGTSNSLAHKGCSGFAKNTPPDVCKTPSPAGPVPIPYPVIISMASDLDKGTKTIKVDGGNMAANKGSEISRCTGDEPGTAGGVVSSTNMKEAKWILYSFDVKLEGKNACRLSDKLTMNHGNTVCLAGWVELPVVKGNTPQQKIACAIYCCDKEVRYNQSPKKRDPKKDCQRLATRKHSCVHNALKKDNDNRIMSSPRFPDPGPPARGTTYKGGGEKGMDALLRLAETLGHKEAKSMKYVTPDTVFKDSKGNWRVIDAKFNCDKKPGKRIDLKRQKSPSVDSTGEEEMTYKERDIYPELKIGNDKVKDAKAMTPKDAEKIIKNTDCVPCEIAK